MTWQILEGKNQIPVILFEAFDAVDSGVVYLQEVIEFYGHEFINELRKIQAVSTVRLCKQFVETFPEH